MKRVFWRPRQVSRTVLLLLMVFALLGMAAVETMPRRVEQPFLADKLAASKLARDAMVALRAERIRRGIEVDAASDPSQSGMIGVVMSSVTSNTGHLAAKQTSANPNFAAVIVEMLGKAGARRGDRVAIGLSGSFPALNIAVLAAVKTLGLEPTIISSASGSQWGANIPGFLWVDMEQFLAAQGFWPYRSAAVSPGGVEDRGLGLPREGRDRIDEAIERSGVPALRPKSFLQSLELRMEIFDRASKPGRFAVYVNVGGGAISVGTAVGKRMFKPGLNRRPPAGPPGPDSVMLRMAESGVPVIHLTQIEDLAERYGLAITPTAPPKVGEGKVFYRNEYDPRIAVGVLIALLALLYVFVRSDLGFRILRSQSAAKRTQQPEPMV